MAEQLDLSGFTLDEITELASHGFGLEALGQRLSAAAVAEIERRQAHSVDGAHSLTDWVASVSGYEHHHAAEFADTAVALDELPEIADAFGSGRFCYDQVRHLARYATADTDAELAETARGLTAAQLRHRARMHQRQSRQDAEGAHRSRHVRTWVRHGRQPGEADMWHIEGALPVAEGSIIEAALADFASRTGPDPATGSYEPITARYADALLSLALGAQAEAQAKDSARATVAVTIPIDTYLGADNTASVDLPLDATIAAETARRLVCDGHLETVLVDPHGTAVGIGRRSRQVPAWLARQVHRRDRGCRFPGCGLDKPALLQRHHIVWCDNGGRTDLDNLIDVCFLHHHLLHEGGWHAHGNANHDLQWRKPGGTPYVPGPHQLPPELKDKTG